VTISFIDPAIPTHDKAYYDAIASSIESRLASWHGGRPTRTRAPQPEWTRKNPNPDWRGNPEPGKGIKSVKCVGGRGTEATREMLINAIDEFCLRHRRAVLDEARDFPHDLEHDIPIGCTGEKELKCPLVATLRVESLNSCRVPLTGRTDEKGLCKWGFLRPVDECDTKSEHHKHGGTLYTERVVFSIDVSRPSKPIYTTVKPKPKPTEQPKHEEGRVTCTRHSQHNLDRHDMMRGVDIFCKMYEHTLVNPLGPPGRRKIRETIPIICGDIGHGTGSGSKPVDHCNIHLNITVSANNNDCKFQLTGGWNPDGLCRYMFRQPVDKCDTDSTKGKHGGSLVTDCAVWEIFPWREKIPIKVWPPRQWDYEPVHPQQLAVGDRRPWTTKTFRDVGPPTGVGLRAQRADCVRRGIPLESCR
jgi:hypothetical protein